LASIAAAGVAAVILCLSTVQSLGHATLTSSVPAGRSVVATAPKEIRLAFNEPVTPLVLKLVASHAPTVFLDRYRSEGRSLVVDAPVEMTPGTYVFSWRVISIDGHPITGTVQFSVGAPSPGLPPDADEGYDQNARVALWIAKLAIYLGLFIGIGGAFASRWLVPSRVTFQLPSYLIRSVLLIGLAAVPLSIGLQGLDALAAQLTQLAWPFVWQTGFSTSWATTAILAAIAFLAGACAIIVRQQLLALAFGFGGLIGIGCALAASGHASAAPPQSLTAPAVGLHGVGIAVWMGSLLPLADAMKLDGDQALRALRRFSRAIPVVLAAILVTGGFLAVVQVEHVEALWSTDYGRVLVAKLAVVAGLLTIAGWNRFALTHLINLGEDKARLDLVRTIAAELMLMTIVLGLVATWRFTPPPRALAAAAAEPAVLSFHTASAFANVAFTPARAGRVQVSMLIMSGNYGPLDPKAVTITLANPPAGVEPIARSAQKSGDGSWRIEALTIPLPGLWSVRIDILMPDDTNATLEDELEIRS
jgi:copper transport protein